jgi:nucleoid DNA-binding protein
MDIDLLAKMVKEAILDHDTVTLPGVGCFVAELAPSTFSDKGYTINPPYRRLFFSPKQGSDTYLADLYARDNEEVNSEMATRILTEFLAEMKEVLKVRKTVVFPGLGRLRATRENHFFFVADEDLDIYPEGLGLAPLSLKTHVETPEEVATAVAGLAEMIAEPEPIPAPEPVEEISPRAALGRNDKVEPEPEAIPEPEVVEEIPDQVGNDGIDQVGNDVPEQVDEIPEQVGNDGKEQETVTEPEPIPAPEPVEEISPRASLGRNDKVEPEPEAIPEPEVVDEIPDQVGNDGEVKVEEIPDQVGNDGIDQVGNDVPEQVDEIPDQVGNDGEVKVDEIPDQVGNDEPEPEPVFVPVPEKNVSRKWLKVLLIALAVIVALLVIVAVLGRVAPDIVDPLLYSKEELQILRY